MPEKPLYQARHSEQHALSGEIGTEDRRNVCGVEAKALTWEWGAANALLIQIWHRVVKASTSRRLGACPLLHL